MKITVDQALQNLMDTIREAVLEEVTRAFSPPNGKPAAKAAPAPKTRRPKKARKPVTRTAPRSKAGNKTAENGEVLAPLVSYIEANPGLNGAKIAEGLGIERKLVTNRLKRAREEGLVKVKGHTRGATWWAK